MAIARGTSSRAFLGWVKVTLTAAAPPPMAARRRTSSGSVRVSSLIRARASSSSQSVRPTMFSTIRSSSSACEYWKLLIESTRVAKGSFRAASVIVSIAFRMSPLKALSSFGFSTISTLSFLA